MNFADSSRSFENAKRSSNFKMERFCDTASTRFIYQHCIGVKGDCQLNSFSLTGVYPVKNRNRNRSGDPDFEPLRSVINPATDLFGSTKMQELLNNYLGNKHTLKKISEQIDLVDQHKVVERSGIRDNDHPWRSKPAASSKRSSML